jgi:hypothetical protein
VSLRAPVVAEGRSSALVPWVRLSDGDLVPAGDQVRVQGSHGEAGLTLAHGVRLSLPAGGELTVGLVPELTAGELLVETGGGAAQWVKAGESSFAVARSSAARLHRSLDAGTAVYVGRIDIASAGRRLAVPALRSASVPALGLVPSQASPLVLDPTDAWDVRFLGSAMDLSAELDAGSAGFSAQAPSVDQASLLSLVPGAVGDGGLLRGRRTGDQLVATAIATSAPGGFSARLPSVVGFRDEGASWGLVVLDQAGAQRGRVVTLVRAAIADWLGRSGGFASVAATPSPIPVAAVGGGGAAAPVTGGSPSPTTTTPVLPTTPPVTTPNPPTTAPPVTLPGPPVTTPAPPGTIPIHTGTPIDDVIDAIGRGVGG